MLQSAFEDKPLCVPRQLAELLQLSCAPTLTPCCATTRSASPSPQVLRVAQRPHARAELAGRPRGQLRPGAEGAPHRALLGL